MVIHGDLFDVLLTLSAASIDAVVTDPPYGIGFMGREWDTFKPEHNEKRHIPNAMKESLNPNLKGRSRAPASSPSAVEYNRSLSGQRAFQDWTAQWAAEVLRVLKPGGHMLVCGAPRSFHRMTCGLEDAGFEVRDCLSWLYGQGFPKSLNFEGGLGTALKPGWEPIVLARKPIEKSTTETLEKYGTGALNIDACRIESGERLLLDARAKITPSQFGAMGGSLAAVTTDLGRWPPNVALDKDAAQLLDAQSGELASGANPERRSSDKHRTVYQGWRGEQTCLPARGFDAGGASRFYYVAKPSREERELGCENLSARSAGEANDRKDGSAGLDSPRAGAGRTGGARNFHPTVKPLALMRWLVRLVTPHGGCVLDPFGGSGTTAMACAAEGLEFILIEKQAEYIPIIEARVRSIAPLFTEGADGPARLPV